VGLFLTVVVRVVLTKAGIDEELPVPVLVYLAFLLAFSFALWLLWLA
jgi:hypothetical protein